MIKPCPFCLSKAMLKTPNQGPKYVACIACGVRGPLNMNEQAALESWNDRSKFASGRISAADPNVPIETYKFIEHLREVADRLQAGDFNASDRGVLLMLAGKTLTLVPLRIANSDIPGVANAFASAVAARSRIQA